MYIGIDVHKDSCMVTDLDEDGKVISQYSLRNTLTGWLKFFDRTPVESSIAIEASTASCPVYDHLVSHGYCVKIAHPYDVTLIGKSRKKTDKQDSYLLAQLLRSNFLPEASLPSRVNRSDRELHRHRISLGKKRSRAQIQVKSLLSQSVITDDQMKITDILTGKCREDLDHMALLPSERIVLDQLLSEIDFLTGQMREIEKELKLLARKSDHAKLFLTVPGISYYSAMTIVNEIQDASRFNSSKKLCSYAGVVPSIYQSGDKEISGRITKRGNVHLRWILNQCIIHTVRYESPLRDFYLRVLEKKGVGCARTAAVRKLLTILFHMLKNNEEYRYQDRQLTLSKWKTVYGKSLQVDC